MLLLVLHVLLLDLLLLDLLLRLRKHPLLRCVLGYS